MRLICPKCGAQYDVPDGAIPPAGRDVQCSACGHTWFEHPRATEGAAEPEPWDEVPRATEDDEEADDLAEALAAPPPLAPPAAPRSTVTPDVAEILRAEAERESQVRADEAARAAVPVTDLPPAPSPMPSHEPTRVVPVAEAPVPAPVQEPQRSPARPASPPDRGLDVERINSSLRTANDRLGGRPPQIGTAPRRGGGFAAGFWGALIVLALLAALYVLAPRIVAALPEAAVVIDPFVAGVDAARLWLDRQVGAFLGADAAAR